MIVPQTGSMPSGSMSRIIYRPTIAAERGFLGSYMNVKGTYDDSCETCNNCGSGDCASCCADADN
jgi:hypothetical protein